MNLRTAFLATLLLATAMAGCLSDETPADDPSPPADGWSPTYGTMPEGQSARDYIESYVMDHPFRYQSQATQAFMDDARDDLVVLLEELGHNVTRQPYDGGENILAIQPGSVSPDQWLVFSAHYDTVGPGIGPTVYGAWDDGAGVAVLLELARVLPTWDLPFTVVLAFFDGEERGLVGSREFTNLYDPTEQTQIDIFANINTDPPGLNWPCGDPAGMFPVKIIHQMAKVDTDARFAWLYDAIEHGLNATEVPGTVRDYSPGIPIATVQGEGVTGGSDHVNFGRIGIANVFLGGVPTTYATGNPEDGGTAALTYPLHTPLDTLEAMEARCVVGTLAGGLHTIVTTMAHSLMWMSETPIPAKPAIE